VKSIEGKVIRKKSKAGKIVLKEELFLHHAEVLQPQEGEGEGGAEGWSGGEESSWETQ